MTATTTCTVSEWHDWWDRQETWWNRPKNYRLARLTHHSTEIIVAATNAAWAPRQENVLRYIKWHQSRKALPERLRYSQVHDGIIVGFAFDKKQTVEDGKRDKNPTSVRAGGSPSRPSSIATADEASCVASRSDHTSQQHPAHLRRCIVHAPDRRGPGRHQADPLRVRCECKAACYLCRRQMSAELDRTHRKNCASTVNQ